MLTEKEKLRIQEGTFYRKQRMSETEVVFAVWFGQDFKVVVSTLTKRDEAGNQWVELLGYGDDGLTKFDQAMEEWRRSRGKSH